MSGIVIPAMVKRVKFVNLVPDGSFEDVANNWNVWLADPTDASQAKDGTRSLRLGGDALAATRTAVVPINGHKYYGREYIKTAGQLDAADCRFEMVGAAGGVEKAFIFGWNRGNYPNWTVNSGIVTIDGSYTDGFGIRTFTVGGTVSAWVDSIVVIDLTEACGAGNEPSKEWCDANIPFFNGSYEMSVPVTSPIQALMAGLTIPEGVVTQIADAAGHVLWQKITAGSVILRPIADVSFEHATYPTNITEGYRLINEEVSDGDATYIWTNGGMQVSHFALGGGNLPTGAIVTSVTIYAVPWSGSNTSARQVISLTLVSVGTGTNLGSVTLYADTTKNFDGSLLDAVEPINNYISSNKTMPPLTLAIESYTSSSSKDASKDTGLTQVYVVLGYEA